MLRRLWRDPETVERGAVLLALIVYALFQINAVWHHGSWGQDFDTHLNWITAAREHPWEFLVRLDPVRPEPPLFYLGAAFVHRFTDDAHFVRVVALVSVLINTIGLIVFYRLLRLMVNDRLIRISCFLFVAFLPVFMIHAVVLATDSMCVPIAVSIWYLLMRMSREEPPRKIGRYLVATIVLLVAGMAVKFTFASQGLALLISLAIMMRTGRVNVKPALIGLATVGILTALAVVLIERSHGALLRESTDAFHVSDLLTLHRRDAHVLVAPPYGQPSRHPEDPEFDRYELLRPHRYSYPALMHLGVYTDILNIYQYDPTDTYFGDRTQAHASRMSLAVKTGLLFSLAAFGASLATIVQSCYRSIVSGRSEYAERAALSFFGVGWFLNIVAFLPMSPAYGNGAWLPRLILPGLMCFAILAATGMERLLAARSRLWAKALLVAVMLQCALHLSFLWPSGVMK